MPDWSYHTVLKPAFFRLPADAVRRFVVSFFGRLCSLPQAYRVIDTLGHMAPGKSLAASVAGVDFASPLGLAPVIDPEGRAVDAFSRFGFGWIVVGPVGLREPERPLVLSRDDASRGVSAAPGQALGLERARQISLRTPGNVRLVFELQLPDAAAEEMVQTGRKLVAGLADLADLLILSPRSSGQLGALGSESRRHVLTEIAAVARSAGRPLFVGLPLGSTPEQDDIVADMEPAGVAGVYYSGRPTTDGSGWLWRGDDSEALERLTWLRREHPDLPVAVDGGSLAPRHALELKKAGADLVLLGPGLVHTGPGLPKRTNESLEHSARQATRPESPATPLARCAWFWGAALGAAMLIGAAMAAWIALTSVLLPYDESFVGKSTAEIEAFNRRIVSFMKHDRITLAGTMISTAILYLALSVFPMRTGHHWAQVSLIVSATIGFLTFFAFLGFGFFDPFHAFVTAVLFQLYVQVIVQPLGAERRLQVTPSLDNDRAWKLSQWGQLCFVVQAIGLLGGGITILTIGVTSVFVVEDIAYLSMDPATIQRFDAELTPLIAHDRATFGGMLVSAGLALLLTTLWAFRRGDRWLWWTYLLTILPPYVMTLWIHVSIGYTDQFHLSPVYIGLGLLAVGLVLSGPHLLPRVTHSGR